MTLTTFIEYKLISRKGEGTFSEVLKAQSIKTGSYVAIKCMKTHFTSVDQVFVLSATSTELSQGQPTQGDPSPSESVSSSPYH